MFGLHIQTFEELKNLVYHEFVEVDHINKLREALDSLTLVKCQTVSAYTNKYRELTLELGPYAPD